MEYLAGQKFGHERPNAATIEHICPRKLGGSNEESNLTVRCNLCNRASGHSMNEWLQYHKHNPPWCEKEQMRLRQQKATTTTKANNPNIKNCLTLPDLPIKFDKLIQIINITFLKSNFSKQSQIIVGKYRLDLNSRKIILENKNLSLTERETNLIIFINKQGNVGIKELQEKVWDYSNDLETHTVETHIYRLRKKMKDKFNDEKFILYDNNGYYIN